MATLPPADVSVTPSRDRDPEAPYGLVDIVVSRNGSDGRSPRARSYRADGNNPAEVTADAIRKVLANPATAEDIART